MLLILHIWFCYESVRPLTVKKKHPIEFCQCRWKIHLTAQWYSVFVKAYETLFTWEVFWIFWIYSLFFSHCNIMIDAWKCGADISENFLSPEMASCIWARKLQDYRNIFIHNHIFIYIVVVQCGYSSPAKHGGAYIWAPGWSELLAFTDMP